MKLRRARCSPVGGGWAKLLSVHNSHPGSESEVTRLSVLSGGHAPSGRLLPVGDAATMGIWVQCRDQPKGRSGLHRSRRGRYGRRSSMGSTSRCSGQSALKRPNGSADTRCPAYGRDAAKGHESPPRPGGHPPATSDQRTRRARWVGCAYPPATIATGRMPARAARACGHFGYGAKLTEIVLLGVLSLRAGQRIYWDAANLKARNLPAADALIHETYRDGWKIG